MVDMQPGDLVFVRGTGLASTLIEDITHSKYSHCAGLVKPNELIEANGFRKTGYQALDFYDGRADVYRCDMSEFQRLQVLDYVTRQVGTRYDYLLIAWEAMRYLFHIMFPYTEMHKLICSTLWSNAYRSAGIDLCPGVIYASPQDLVESKLLTYVGSY